MHDLHQTDSDCAGAHRSIVLTPDRKGSAGISITAEERP